MYVIIIIHHIVSSEFRERRMLVSLLLSVVWHKNCRRLWRPCTVTARRLVERKRGREDRRKEERNGGREGVT